MSTYFEKSQHPDRKGEGGVNPYGQPDSKNTVFFLTTSLNILTILSHFPPLVYFVFVSSKIMSQDFMSKIIPHGVCFLLGKVRCILGHSTSLCFALESH